MAKKATRKNPSFVLSVTATFLVAYSASSLVTLISTNLAWYENYEKDRKIELVNFAKLAKLLLKHDEPKELLLRLAEARQQKKIEFYLLRRGNEVLGFEDKALGQSILGITFEPRKMVINNGNVFLDLPENGFDIVIGQNRGRATYLTLLWERARNRLLIEVVLMALLAGAIVLYNFRDFAAVIRALQSRSGKSKFDGIHTNSAEAGVMLRSLQSYDQNLHHFRQESVGYQQQIVSALRTELQSGKAPPYEFNCVMVRTDINKYSTICAEHTMAAFLPVVNEFFAGASRIVETYRGYVADFVGDEIIFYFKEENHPSAEATALAAVRDIEAYAEKIHEAVNHKYPFRVKSSIASGPLHFGPQVDRLSLSGGVFVETVRTLSEVEEKEENSVYFPSRLNNAMGAVATPIFRKSVKLRGIPGDTQLFKVEHYFTFKEILAAQNYNSLIYFLDHAHLLAMLESLASESNQTAPYFLAAFNAVGKGSASPEMIDAAIRATEMIHARGQEKELPLLRGLLSSFRKLLSPEAYNEEVREMLFRLLAHPDGRVAANSIDAITYFDPAGEEESLSALIQRGDNRILANVFIKMGLRDLSGKVTAGIRNMLLSKDPQFIASGAYALAEIARHYSQSDPARFQARSDISDIYLRIAELRDHENEIVRRQVARAIAARGEDSFELKIAA